MIFLWYKRDKTGFIVPPSIIIGKTNESRVQKNTFYDGFALVGTDAEPFL